MVSPRRPRVSRDAPSLDHSRSGASNMQRERLGRRDARYRSPPPIRHGRPIPALLTRTLTPPNRRITSSTTTWPSTLQETSAARRTPLDRRWPGSPPQPDLARRSTTATAAPSRVNASEVRSRSRPGSPPRPGPRNASTLLSAGRGVTHGPRGTPFAPWTRPRTARAARRSPRLAQSVAPTPRAAGRLHRWRYVVSTREDTTP